LTGRILHLSDIHFGTENVAAVAATRDIALAGDFDLIAITGDVTSYGKPEEFAAASAFINALPERRIVTPGNHDTPWLGLVARIFHPFARYEHFFGDPEFAAFDGAGVAARAFNTARGIQFRKNWSKGCAGGRDVERVIHSFVDTEPGALRIVLCHHPLTEITGGPMTGEVWGGEEAALKLAEARVDLVLTGHVHVPFVHALSEGDGQTHAVGCGTLSIRERGAPAGFNIIEFDGKDVQVTAQGWTGSKFEPVRTWAITRR
jgi:3',5'-cyclic AMP phosphodiesterase CpdA